MKKASNSHRELVVDILSASFDDNQSINYIVKQDAQRRQRIRYLMGYCFDTTLKNGIANISDDENACSLILLSEIKQSTIWQNALLVKNCVGVGNVRKVLSREKMLKVHHPKDPFYYLWFIGVFPEFQNKGIGSLFFEEVLDMSDNNKRPIYLETSVLRNVPWYQKYGFQVFNKLDIGCKMYQMIRY